MENLKDWVSKCDVSSKREALKRLILLALWGARQYVAAVHLLDENEVFLNKSDWPYYALGIEILKARKHEFFSMNNEDFQGSLQGVPWNPVMIIMGVQGQKEVFDV